MKMETSDRRFLVRPGAMEARQTHLTHKETIFFILLIHRKIVLRSHRIEFPRFLTELWSRPLLLPFIFSLAIYILLHLGHHSFDRVVKSSPPFFLSAAPDFLLNFWRKTTVLFLPRERYEINEKDYYRTKYR